MSLWQSRYHRLRKHNMPLSKAQHLDPNTGPKRILALDGGGIRGVLTLEYLEVIEALLRQRRKDPNLLLSDYFDLIGGTSTGSIIAAGLACGMPVKDIKKLYYRLGASVFVPTGLGIVVPKFQVKALQKALDGALGADTHSRQRGDPHRAHDHDKASRYRQPVAPE
jgi:uncharacterized protein